MRVSGVFRGCPELFRRHFSCVSTPGSLVIGSKTRFWGFSRGAAEFQTFRLSEFPTFGISELRSGDIRYMLGVMQRRLTIGSKGSVTIPFRMRVNWGLKGND